MTDNSFLPGVGLIVIAAALVGLVAHRFGTPSIIAYAVAGLLLGPVSGLMDNEPSIDGIAQMGLLLMLFTIGVELRPEMAGYVARTALLAALARIAFTAAGGWLLCLLLGFTTPEAYVIAAALTISSAAVLVNGFSTANELAKEEGRTAIGVVVVQNVLALGVLAVFATGGANHTDAADTREGPTAGPLIGFFTLVTATLTAGRLLRRKLASVMSSIPDITLIWALAWCFVTAAAATWVGLHPAVGAYLAGLSLAGLRNRGNLQHALRPVVQISFVIFFTTQGVLVDVAGIREHALALLVLSVFVLLGNSLLLLGIFYRAGYTPLTAWRASVVVSPVGELSFVLAAVALSAGLISSSASSLIAAIGLLTICASLSTLRYADRVHAWLSSTGVLELIGRSPRRLEG